MSETPKTVFVTKYALTKGVLEAPVRTTHDGDGVKVEWAGGLNGSAWFHGAHWTPSKAEALARAERMKTRKIASLRKQIAKLEAMTFA